MFTKMRKYRRHLHYTMIPKNMPVMIRNELETAFRGAMLFIPRMKTTKPKRHRTTPASMILVSTLSTN